MEEVEKKREELRQTQMERGSCCCCNVMLNSNMQCSHHGNGGSSETTHGAENVCLLESLHVSMCLCIWVSVKHNMLSLCH